MKKISVIFMCLVILFSFAACGKDITLEEAKDIAIEHAKLAKEDVTFTKTEIDSDLTGTEYEIEFVCPTGNYKYEISGKGKIISVEAETAELPSGILPSGQSAAASDVLTEDEALQIVLKDIGIEKSDAKGIKIHIDTEDGIYVYEVEMKVGKDKYEYDINANTGDIVKCEREVG